MYVAGSTLKEVGGTHVRGIRVGERSPTVNLGEVVRLAAIRPRTAPLHA